jgi:hypothetical protein
LTLILEVLGTPSVRAIGLPLSRGGWPMQMDDFNEITASRSKWVDPEHKAA